MLPEGKFLHQCLAQHCRRIKIISEVMHATSKYDISDLLEKLQEEYTYPAGLLDLPDRLQVPYSKPLLEEGASLEELAKVFSDKGLFEAAALLRELARLEEEY